jgi:hypothetical protein
MLLMKTKVKMVKVQSQMTIKQILITPLKLFQIRQKSLKQPEKIDLLHIKLLLMPLLKRLLEPHQLMLPTQLTQEKLLLLKLLSPRKLNLMKPLPPLDKKIDTTNAPEAVEAPAGAKEADPAPLSDDEKMRNHILRIAATGQEAIKVADIGVEKVAEAYAPKEKEGKPAPGTPEAAEKTNEEREADGKALGEAAKATQK